MKQLLTLILITVLFSLNLRAQLVYLIDDDVQKNKYNGFVYDGYYISKGTTGFVTMGGLYYYISPNGKLIQTDGTEKNTKTITTFKPQDIPYLKATNKYVYFARDYDDGAVKVLYRYSPSSGVNKVTNPSENNADFLLNGNVVNNSFTADEIFTSYDKDYLLIRKFTKDVFYIYIIKDHNDNAKVQLVEKRNLNNNNVQTPIGVNTSIEAFNSDIYWNGQVKKTTAYETIVMVNQQTKDNSDIYEFKTNFILASKRITLYEGFNRTKNNIYTLGKITDSATQKSYFRLFTYNNKNITSTSELFNLINDDAQTQTIDGNIYISCKGELQVFNEKTGVYRKVFSKSNATNGWQNILPKTRFLKVGNYFLGYDNKPFVYNANNNIFQPLQATSTYQDNIFYLNKPLFYAGKNSFYFTSIFDGKEMFARYNPVTNVYTPIQFPEYKKEKFEKIRAIFQDSICSNKLIILTSYIGKKDKPVYKTFMYTEDGEALATTATVLNFSNLKSNVVNNIEPVKEVDYSKFDFKLFIDEIKKVLNNQANQFDDIIGENIPNEFGNKYKATVNLTNFAETIIMDYKSVSKLKRYQAVSYNINGKEAGLNFLNALDKEIQTLIAGNNIIRIVDVDVKTRKVINYKFSINDENNVIQIDLYTNSKAEDANNATYTITINMDKKTP